MNEKSLSPFRPASTKIFYLVDHCTRDAMERITTTLNTCCDNKSPRKVIWRSRTIIRDGAFINGGMRERGPLTPPSSLPLGSDQLFFGILPDGYAQSKHAPLNLGGGP